MKYFLLVIIIFVAAKSSADSILCLINSDKMNSVFIEFDQNKRGVLNIDLLQESAPTIRIYSRWPMIRGELIATYCIPNENEYREHSNEYYVNSQCFTANMGLAFFNARFSNTGGGKLSYLKADLATVNLDFSDCQ